MLCLVVVLVLAYDKWRPLVPAEQRAEFKYYQVDPGLERRTKVKAHRKASKKQRMDRSRTKECTNPPKEATQLADNGDSGAANTSEIATPAHTE